MRTYTINETLSITEEFVRNRMLPDRSYWGINGSSQSFYWTDAGRTPEVGLHLLFAVDCYGNFTPKVSVNFCAGQWDPVNVMAYFNLVNEVADIGRELQEKLSQMKIKVTPDP